MHARLSAATRALLDATIGLRAQRFAGAVVRQVAFPPGHDPRAPARDAEVAAALVRFLHEAEGIQTGERPTGPAPSAELLSAIFQNVDLLYADGYAAADRVSLHLMSLAWREQDVDAAAASEQREGR